VGMNRESEGLATCPTKTQPGGPGLEGTVGAKRRPACTIVKRYAPGRQRQVVDLPYGNSRGTRARTTHRDLVLIGITKCTPVAYGRRQGSCFFHAGET
jgi:hypothetical protein